MTDTGGDAPVALVEARNGTVSLATQSFGDDSGHPVVLIMGATASMLWWPDGLCARLATAGNHVIRYDHRDTGTSTSHPLGHVTYRVEDLVDDLIAVLDVHRLESAHLVGMSLGGYIAQIAALAHPDRVRSLTLIASEPLGGVLDSGGIDPAFMEHFAAMDHLDWSDRVQVVSFMMGIARLSTGAGRTFDADASERRVAAEFDRAAMIESAFNHSMISADESWNGRLSDIEVPVLVIHGSDDPIIPVANRVCHRCAGPSRPDGDPRGRRTRTQRRRHPHHLRRVRPVQSRYRALIMLGSSAVSRRR